MVKALAVEFHNGVLFPSVVLGTCHLTTEHENAILTALRSGYKGIDDAVLYDNEPDMGECVRKYNKPTAQEDPRKVFKVPANMKLVDDTEWYESFATPHGNPHDDRAVWVTSKACFDNPDHTKRLFSPEGIRRQFEQHLESFGRKTADLFILHWPGYPVNDRFYKIAADSQPSENTDKCRIECWKTLEELYHAGRVRAIGVSNYMYKHMKALIDDIEARKKGGDTKATIPMYNQIEVSPLLTPPQDLVDLCKQYEIVIGGYRVLGGGKSNEIKEAPIIQELANKYGKQPTAIVVRWGVQQGVTMLPRTSSAEHAIQNIDILDFELTDEEMKSISSLNRGHRYCDDPNLIN